MPPFTNSDHNGDAYQWDNWDDAREVEVCLEDIT